MKNISENIPMLQNNNEFACYLLKFYRSVHNLPKEMLGLRQPEWMYKRGTFLASISTADKNTILTEDPELHLTQ